MTAAERQAVRRERLARQGDADGRKLSTLTVELPLEVLAALDKFVQFKDVTKNSAIEKLLRGQLMRKR